MDSYRTAAQYTSDAVVNIHPHAALFAFKAIVSKVHIHRWDTSVVQGSTLVCAESSVAQFQ